ncbi:undecaprenyl-diphosphate phosphatase [Phycisphaerales bacterium AB-hyl4]|uniref:Undecaprenyl-diphosphatase n=1 Tax=Natronomicrosphaera hydrolytica TaxID=3242702 RepID=A0ABV4U7M4_9BACT
MTIFEAILLGIVQGVFMFFPVSSTSHLVLMQHWLISSGSTMPSPDSEEMILFDLVVHVGTLVSIVVVFRKSLRRFLDDLRDDLQAWVRGEASLNDALHLRLALLGLVAVFVTGTVGLACKPIFEVVFGHPLAIAGTLTITGVLLYFTDSVGPRPRGLRQLTLYVAIAIGLAQAFALVPGFSRSGLTIAIALYIGLKRRWAAEFSFFIAIPTILAATLVQAMQVWRSDTPLEIGFAPLFTGFVVAALVGIGALYLVLTLLYRARFRYFAYYVWCLAAMVALFGIRELLA